MNKYKICNNKIYNDKNELAVLISFSEPPEHNEFAGFSSCTNNRFDYTPELPFLTEVIMHILGYNQIDVQTLKNLTFLSLKRVGKLVDTNPENNKDKSDEEDITNDEKLEEIFNNYEFNYDCADYLKVVWIPRGKIFRIISDEYGNDILEFFNIKEWFTS